MSMTFPGSAVRFGAPWATSLKIVTGLSFLILVGVACIGLLTGPGNVVWLLAMVVGPLLVLAVASLFAIRGYVLADEALWIERPLWSTQVDLSDLESAEATPFAMRRSLRYFGNGGLFCFAGWFRNKQLGPYRAFATDPARTVVLRFARRVIVITPEKPEEFVGALEAMTA